MNSLRKAQILRDVTHLILKIDSLKKSMNALRCKQQKLVAESPAPPKPNNNFMMPELYRLNEGY